MTSNRAAELIDSLLGCRVYGVHDSGYSAEHGPSLIERYGRAALEAHLHVSLRRCQEVDLSGICAVLQRAIREDRVRGSAGGHGESRGRHHGMAWRDEPMFVAVRQLAQYPQGMGDQLDIPSVIRLQVLDDCLSSGTDVFDLSLVFGEVAGGVADGELRRVFQFCDSAIDLDLGLHEQKDGVVKSRPKLVSGFAEEQRYSGWDGTQTSDAHDVVAVLLERKGIGVFLPEGAQVAIEQLEVAVCPFKPFRDPREDREVQYASGHGEEERQRADTEDASRSGYTDTDPRGRVP